MYIYTATYVATYLYIYAYIIHNIYSQVCICDCIKLNLQIKLERVPDKEVRISKYIILIALIVASWLYIFVLKNIIPVNVS